MKNSGFTLLEILVATAVMSVLLTVLYGAYTSNLEAIQTSRSSGQLSQTARIVLERMSKDLESAFITVPYTETPVALGMRLEEQRIGERPAARLDFSALSHISFSGKGEGDLCEVAYFLEEDPEGGGLILYRRDDGSPDHDFTEGGYREELARMVAGLEIVFQDDQGREHAAWRAENDGALPALVRIRLRLADGSGRERVFSTRVRPALANPKPE